MPRKKTKGLTEREAEIISILWELGEATVEDIRARLPGTPSASTVRSLLGIMEERRLITDDGRGYGRHYRALVGEAEIQRSALRRLVDTLFAGSTEAVLLRLMDDANVDMDQIRALHEQLQQRRGCAEE